MKIKITDFAFRHFDPKFGGTKILDYTIEQFEHVINHDDSLILFALRNQGTSHGILDHVKVHDGYAPFCKLVAVRNFTNARVGSLPKTLENYSFIRSGYSGRRDTELPVFSRWLELPVRTPKAEWLVLVLYSKEQIELEAKGEDNATEMFGFDADWGVVSILGQSHSDEELMKPETMIRNAGYNTEEYQKKAVEEFMKLLKMAAAGYNYTEEDVKTILNLQGTMVGGSGVPLNREKYLRSVDFWDNNISLK